MERRPLVQHLRLLPGGDASVSSALAATLVLYGVLLSVGMIIAFALLGRGGGGDGFVSVFTLANSLPCAVIAAWTGLRISKSKHIGTDEAAVDPGTRRVYYGDEITRVPHTTLVFSLQPRQVPVTMADGRRLTLFVRVNSDPEDVLALAEELRAHPGLELEDLVDTLVSEPVGEMLPDPEGIREALRDQLLPKGIVITRVSVS